MVTPYAYLVHAILQIAASFLIYRELKQNPNKAMALLLRGFIIIAAGFLIAGLAMFISTNPAVWINAVLLAVLSFSIGIAYLMRTVYLVTGFPLLRALYRANILVGVATFCYALLFTEYSAYLADLNVIVFSFDPLVRLGILVSNSGALFFLALFFIPRVRYERGLTRTRAALFIVAFMLFAINSGLVYGTELPRVYLAAFIIGFLGSFTAFWSVLYRQMVAFLPFGIDEWLRPRRESTR